MEFLVVTKLLLLEFYPMVWSPVWFSGIHALMQFHCSWHSDDRLIEHDKHMSDNIWTKTFVVWGKQEREQHNFLSFIMLTRALFLVLWPPPIPTCYCSTSPPTTWTWNVLMPWLMLSIILTEALFWYHTISVFLKRLLKLFGWLEMDELKHGTGTFVVTKPVSLRIANFDFLINYKYFRP